MVPGEGMPVHHSTEKGTLFVEYTVRFPDSITDEQAKGM